MSVVYVGVALAVVSAIGAGVSAGMQADAQRKQANYQAQLDNNAAIVAANNAKIAKWNRSDALQRGEQSAQNAMLERQQLIGRQRATLAASGVDLTQGSALDLLASTEYLGQIEVNNIQSNAAREAWGYDLESNNYINQSNIEIANSGFEGWRAKNSNPGVAGGMAFAGSLLSSASLYASAGAKGGSGGGGGNGRGAIGGGSSM
jgi:hypothetical protein